MALGLPRWNFKQDQREDTQDHWVYPFHFCPGINSLLGPWTMCLGAGHASDSQVSYQYPNIHLDRNKITDLRKHREKYDCGDKSKTHCDPFVISISPPFRYPVGIPQQKPRKRPGPSLPVVLGSSSKWRRSVFKCLDGDGTACGMFLSPRCGDRFTNQDGMCLLDSPSEGSGSSRKWGFDR